MIFALTALVLSVLLVDAIRARSSVLAALMVGVAPYFLLTAFMISAPGYLPAIANEQSVFIAKIIMVLGIAIAVAFLLTRWIKPQNGEFGGNG